MLLKESEVIKNMLIEKEGDKTKSPRSSPFHAWCLGLTFNPRHPIQHFWQKIIKRRVQLNWRFLTLQLFLFLYLHRKLDVFIADDVSLEYKSMSKCGLKVVGEPFAMSGTSISVKKGNPLFQQLNEALQAVRAEGLTDFIQTFWVKKYGSCTRETPPTQLKLEDLSGLFVQLTIAIVGCILGTIFHRTFYYFRKRWSYEADDLDDPSRFSQLETLVW